MKKYHARTKDRFDPHVDVQDHASARRYLAFLFYLNEDFSGGETEFPHHSRKITPKTETTGDCLSSNLAISSCRIES